LIIGRIRIAPREIGRISRRQDEPHVVVNLGKFESGAILTVMRSEYDNPVCAPVGTTLFDEK
jgi:hypothetical protein